jgi:hypothetical protein
MKTLPMAIAMAALSATSASPSPIDSSYYHFFDLPQCSMFGTDPILRITTSLRTAIATEPIANANAQEMTRAGACWMAENECTYCAKFSNLNVASAHLRLITRLSPRYQTRHCQIP